MTAPCGGCLQTPTDENGSAEANRQPGSTQAAGGAVAKRPARRLPGYEDQAEETRAQVAPESAGGSNSKAAESKAPAKKPATKKQAASAAAPDAPAAPDAAAASAGADAQAVRLHCLFLRACVQWNGSYQCSSAWAAGRLL